MFDIRKGCDLPLAGRPAGDIVDTTPSSTVAVYPQEYDGVRQKLCVDEGAVVARGAALLLDKRNTDFKVRAPAGGRVSSIRRGARRFVEEITIETDSNAQEETFQSFSRDELSSLDRDAAVNMLVSTGYLVLVRQRPFGIMADPAASPKCIFVNATNTAPFLADAGVAATDDPDAFEAGLLVMSRLTSGPVHLCIGPSAPDTLRNAATAKIHEFSGPHPSGNTSVHISRVSPMKPSDTIWEVRAVDVVLIGRLFLDGKLPTHRIVSLGGPAVLDDACRHYRVAIGSPLDCVLGSRLKDGEVRVISGDILSGEHIPASGALRLRQSSITVLAEDRERRFLGWTMPGFDQFSLGKLFASSWLPRSRPWALGTSAHGEDRAMVLTGLYDKVMPLDIMVDYLVRAVLAGDTDEAISLGILETLPEDFALCEVACPSKTDIQSIIRRGLDMIREEGI